MWTSIESAVRCGEPRETAHGARQLLVGVKGLAQLDVGSGPVNAPAPTRNAEHIIADFMVPMLYRY